jgi:hypothetical protein
MKTKSIVAAALILTCVATSRSQTADDYVTLGRGYLTATNLIAANNNFSYALGLSPLNQPANVLYAVTRLLMLPNRPAGSNFLSRLGMPATGRDLYHWTAVLPVDTNHLPLMPGDVNADELSALLRTNVLSELIAAEANLAQVADTNFTLSLTADETRMAAVTLDYGDIQMLRAMLQASAYICYNTYSWNLNAQYVVIYSLLSNDQFSLERLLTDYPQLFTFATTNDMNAAKTAVTNGIDRYLAASQFIRNRAKNVTRLFNFGASFTVKEKNFRLTLADLKQSLNGKVTLTANPNYAMYLPSLFSGNNSFRSWLPEFVGNTFVLGTLPDITFGGLIDGLSRQQTESVLANGFKRTSHTIPIPRLDAPYPTGDHQFAFPVHTLFNHGYVVQTSTNLQDWSDDASFFGLSDTMLFGDPAAAFPQRYYRVEDRTDDMPPPSNGDFNSRIPLTGLGITAAGYTTVFSSSVWWSWTSPVSGTVEVATVGSGYTPLVSIYTGSVFSNLTSIADGYGSATFTASAGTVYQIQLGGGWPPGGIQIEITTPPVLTITSPIDGMAFNAGTNITCSAWSYDYDGIIRKLQFYANETLLGSTTNSSISLTWSNVPPGYHYIYATATDNLGVSTTDYLGITVHPPNDDFANATAIVGSVVSVAGTNAGASSEIGEPSHAGETGGASVWWSWKAPSNGPVTINATLVDQWGNQLAPLLGVYTGSVVSALTTVASNAPYFSVIPAQVSFTASAGTTYKIAVDGAGGSYGSIDLNIIPSAAPITSIQSPTNSAVFYTTAPTNVTLSAAASDSDGSISRVDFYGSVGYGYPFLIGSVSHSPYSLVWSNLGSSDYAVAVAATDNSGVTTYSDPVLFTVANPPPTNDNFANRILLSGLVVTTNGDNTYATREANEPYHAGDYGGRSVWWSWVAPTNATFRVTISTTSVYYPILAVYTGTQLSSLASIASGRGSSYYLQTSFSATNGQTYQIAVDDYNGNGSSYNLSISR